MPPPTALEEAIRLSVDYITNKAQHFFSVVRSKQEDGVLWFAFSYKEEPIETALRNQKILSADDVSKNGTLSVKKTAFLPISAIITTDSKPLLDMVARCDKRQQFVAWFTLEQTSYNFNGTERQIAAGAGSGSNPQVSKVIIVDTQFPQSVNTLAYNRNSHHHHQPQNMPSRFATPGRAGILKNSQQNQPNATTTTSSSLDDLKRDMQATASQLQQQQREFHATPNKTLSGRSMMTTMNEMNHNNNHRTDSPPGAMQRQQSALSNFGASGSSSSSPLHHQSAALPDANYSHLLKVSLQISDSVAKLSSKLEDLADRYNNFEKAISAEIVDLKKRVQKNEGSLSEIKPKLQEVSDSTLHFGTKIAHLRQESMALFEGVSKRVQNVADSVISHNLGMVNQHQTASNSNNGNFQQQQQSSSSFAFTNNNNNSMQSTSRSHHQQQRSSSAALQAVEEAEKAIDFDQLMAKHGSSSGSFDNAKNQKVSFSTNVNCDHDENDNNNNNNHQPHHHQDPSQDALESFLSDNYDRKPNFATRKAELEAREHAMKYAQEAVDDYNTLSRDVITNENEKLQKSDDHPISLTGVHRQKASLELARQHAADRSEAQAIATSYMSERSRAIRDSTIDDHQNINNIKPGSYRSGNMNTSIGVAVPLESATRGGREDDEDFVVSSGLRMNMMSLAPNNNNNKKSSESLADMISSMERRLQV